MLYFSITKNTPFIGGIFILVLSLYSVSVFSDSYQDNFVWFSLETDNYSQSIPIKDLQDDSPRHYESGTHIFSFSKWQAGFSITPYASFGVVQRQDVYVRHSPDTALIYYNSNEHNVLDERQYNLLLKGYAQQTKGIVSKLNYSGSFFRTEWTFELGKASNLTWIDIDGDLIYEGSEIKGDTKLNYFYERDALFDRNVKPAYGWYYSVSLDAAVTSKIGVHRLQILDLYNQTEWESAPHTQASLNTNRIADQNEQGHISVRPLGSGIENFQDLRVRLPPRIEFKNEFTSIYSWIPILGTQYFNGEYYPYVGLKPWPHVSTSYHVKSKSYELSHHLNSKVHYQIELDTLNVKFMRRLNLTISLSW